MEFLKSLKRYIHLHFVWLIKIKSLWGVALPFVLLIVITFLPWRLSDLTRYVGLTLEVLGLFTVAIGLRGKRELFKKPSFIEHIKNWWKQRPTWKPVTLSASSTFSIGSFISSARASAWHGSKDNTIKHRLEAVEKNLLSLRSELQTFEQDTNAKHAKLDKVIEGERQTRDSSVQEIRIQIEDLAARDISFEALGVYWLFCGLVFSSLSNEISDLLVFLK